MAELPDHAPASFTWRRVAHRVARAEGPERISPEWWRFGDAPEEKRPRTRDYYRVEDEDGRRFWLFREGLYGREDIRARKEGEPQAGPDPNVVPHLPAWWMHGVFA